MRANDPVPVKLRDSDIRVQLNLWLATKFAYDSTTVIYSELTIPRPSSRIDIAVANGALAGFEIKSDVDSLARLPRQISGFTKVFEYLTLVTTMTHLEKSRALLPDCWGILVMDGSRIKTVKRPKLNKGVSGENALYLLTREELFDITKSYDIISPKRSVKRSLINDILDRVPLNGIMQSVRESLKSRPTPICHQSHQMAVDI